jgi:coenzyme F420-0:L-glutamate ligase/coenzyme F420-1:gamma-L-glutamate ligase
MSDSLIDQPDQTWRQSPRSSMISIVPLAGIGEIASGDDLVAIMDAAMQPFSPENGDILVVTSKILSKAEGRQVDLAMVTPGAQARDIAGTIGKDPRLVELALSESSAVVRAAPGVLITRHRLGLVMANAGIDASNIGAGGGDRVLLLPEDPDASAARLRDGLMARLGITLGVILSDSFGRPWREGVVNVAVGAAGLPAIHDRRGDTDRDGRVLQVTQIAYGDLIASAAGLAMGEAAEGIPAALVRGLALPAMDVPASALVRTATQDLFR